MYQSTGLIEQTTYWSGAQCALSFSRTVRSYSKISFGDAQCATETLTGFNKLNVRRCFVTAGLCAVHTRFFVPHFRPICSLCEFDVTCQQQTAHATTDNRVSLPGQMTLEKHRVPLATTPTARQRYQYLLIWKYNENCKLLLK